MGELRRDALTGRWVILAPDRADRPRAPRPRTAPTSSEGVVDGCPFCPGHERATPPELARWGTGTADGPGWEVRVVPNLYPIVRSDGGDPGDHDLLRRPARGEHEVAVLSPDHHRSLAHLDHRQVLQVLVALRDRARVHAAAGYAYTQVMVNHGVGGGASLAHPHAQIVAIEVAPPTVEEEVAHLTAADECVLCREVQRQDDDASLHVAGQDARLWCPWWSSTAYELLLVPRQHRRRFEDAGPELEAVAAAVREGLARLDRLLGDPPYNLVVHSLPADRQGRFHWHIHIRPRLQLEAGFELGTGILVNTVDPAEAARRLRGGAR
jgi:UDPglucose--hexose-1-phosphate uridylyltransferase